MRLKISIFAVLLLFFYSSCHTVYKVIGKKAELKDWCNYSYRNNRYSEANFYTEYQVVSCKKKKYVEKLRNDLEFKMREELSEKIMTSINTDNRINQSQTSTNGGLSYYSQSNFSSIQKSFTKLSNINKDYVYDPINHQLHVFLFVEKNTLRNSYISLVKQVIRIAQSLANSIKETAPDKDSKLFNELMSQLNAKKREIDIDRDVLNILNKNDRFISDDMEEINILYETLIIDINVLLSNNDNSYVQNLLTEGNKLFLQKTPSSYQKAIEKYNEVLVFSPSNEDALTKKRACIEELVANKTILLDKAELAKDYESALNELHGIIDLDNTLYNQYKAKDLDLQDKFFKKTTTDIERLIEYNDVELATVKFSKLEAYAQLDIKKYNSIKKKLEDMRVDKAITNIDEEIYNKKYFEALDKISIFRKDYPYNEKIINKLNEVSFKIYKEKKHEFLKDKPTRNTLEFNFGVATRPNQFISENQIKVNNQEYLFDDLFSSFQVGLYRKYNIKPRKNNLTKAKYGYGQAGLRFGYLNPKSGIYDLQGDTINPYLPNITTVCGSLVVRRFLMINLGVAATQDSSGLKFTNKTFGLGEIGLRIPFGPVHLTTDVCTYTDFDRIYKIYFKMGLSANIGLNKKFTKSDKNNIRNQISKLSYKE